MTTTAICLGPRPKIHRLPSLPPLEKRQERLRAAGFVGLWGGVFVALVVVSITVKNQSFILPASQTESETTVAVTAEDVAALAATVAVSDAAAMLPAAISDAQAAEIPENRHKTIILQGDSETIIGQLARIPAENEHITEIRPLSGIDKDAGRELLSIVSKY